MSARVSAFLGVLCWMLLATPSVAAPHWGNGFEPPPPQTRWLFPNLRPGDEAFFADPSGWPAALAATDVLGLYVGALQIATPAQLGPVLGLAQQHGLRVVVEAGGLRPCLCSGAAMAAAEIPMLEKVEQAGIDDFLVVMDNVWSFVGSPSVYAPPASCPNGGQPACAHGAATFAAELSNYMQALRQRFPQVRFGWIESLNIYGFEGLPGLGGQGQFDLKPVIEATLNEAWTRGLPLDFFHVDAPLGGILNYPTDPLAKLRRVEGMIRGRGLRFGILLTNGPWTSTPDAQFAFDVQAYHDCYVGAGGRLDNVVVQSWWSQPGSPSLALPAAFAPENNPLSFTAVFNQVAARVADPTLIQSCPYVFQAAP
jgi:hypothetical protein